MQEWFPKDKTCIVGIGETEYTQWGQIGRPEFQLACEAVIKAADDAGIPVEDIDGICSYAGDRNEATRLATTLGMKHVRFSNMVWGGGGGGCCAAVMNACLAVATGSAHYVVAFRALAQGQFIRFGQSSSASDVAGPRAFSIPFGLMVPSQSYALKARRHMYEYGTTSRQFGAVALACYKHAQNNPRAAAYGKPITMEDHQSSRMICDPFRLYDCCRESDGATAVIITSAERARQLRQRPAYVLAASQGIEYRAGVGAEQTWGKLDFPTGHLEKVAAELFGRAGIGPEDVDVAQFYENFTPLTIMSIENHGFCKKGEGGSFVENGRIEWPDGELPINTSGGNLAEAYIHGFELLNEAVRQMRGTSTCQVQDAEVCLVSGAPGAILSSDLVLRK